MRHDINTEHGGGGGEHRGLLKYHEKYFLWSSYFDLAFHLRCCGPLRLFPLTHMCVTMWKYKQILMSPIKLFRWYNVRVACLVWGIPQMRHVRQTMYQRKLVKLYY